NVSVYAVDAAGLRVMSPLAENIRQENSLAGRRSRAAQANEDTSGHPMSRDLERNEDFLRLNPDSGLTTLADQTGGFLISDTNNLANGLVRIDEDLRFHYVLSYVPKNLEYDGKFRQVSVKVDKSALEVQTRKGYYAVPSAGGTPVLDFEVPALAALSNERRQNTLPVRVSSLSFPESSRPGLVPVLVRVPAAALSYTLDNEKKTYKGDFTILALVKDKSGMVVKKLSQHYQLTGSLDNLQSAKSGEILFYREAQLEPGPYSIQAIGYDTATARSGVAKASVDVPPSDVSKLRLSSVMVLNRVERLSAADQKVANPFHYGELLVYPNMGDVLHKASRKELAFFFTAYTAKGASAAPKL
ncbi:MAG: VWA domain-containing protein, partial [Blastocatellia bacterium]